MKLDKMSMLNSLEARAPFLDYRLVEFALSIPMTTGYRVGVEKHILRETFRGLLPPPAWREKNRDSIYHRSMAERKTSIPCAGSSYPLRKSGRTDSLTSRRSRTAGQAFSGGRDFRSVYSFGPHAPNVVGFFRS